MADNVPRADAGVKIFYRGPNPLGAHDRRPERREVVDAHGLDVFDMGTDAAQGNDEGIEDKTGIDAGAEEGYSRLFKGRIQFSRQLWLLRLGISHFLRNGDAVHFCRRHQLQLG